MHFVLNKIWLQQAESHDLLNCLLQIPEDGLLADFIVGTFDIIKNRTSEIESSKV